MSKPLFIVGNGQLAQLYCSTFNRFTDYRVAGFAVDRDMITTDSLVGLPVVPLDEVESHFPPDAVHAFVGIGPVGNNAVRAAKFLEMEQKKYRFANCISPHAVVSPDVQIGKNVVIGHLTVVSPWVSIGDDVVIGSTSSIGHHSRIHDHAFLPVHVVVAGSVVIGERAFVGAGATIRDNVTIGAGSVIGAGATVLADVEPGAVYVSERAKRLPMAADQVRL